MNEALSTKISIAKACLARLKEATEDPEVRAAICDGFWENDNPEVFSESAELAAKNYSDNEPIELLCSVSLPKLYVSFTKDKETDDYIFLYENSTGKS